MSFPPLREDLVGLAPYGAPQLDVPVTLNVNENPYPPSQAVVDDIAASVAAVAGGLNRYPDREFTELRTALAAYLSTDAGHEITPDRVWAANGSNEVMLHLLQAFGGPGRTALSFAPTYSMYPEYARDTGTALGRRPARDRTSRSTRRTRGTWCSSTGRAWCCCRRRTTRRARPCRSTWSRRSARRPVTGWSWWTRRTPSSGARARRARWSCCRPCATSRSRGR